MPDRLHHDFKLLPRKSVALRLALLLTFVALSGLTHAQDPTPANTEPQTQQAPAQAGKNVEHEEAGIAEEPFDKCARISSPRLIALAGVVTCSTLRRAIWKRAAKGLMAVKLKTSIGFANTALE